MKRLSRLVGFLLNKITVGYFFVALVGFIAGNIWLMPRQYIVMKVYGDRYSQLIFKCDNVMRDHYISKAKIMSKANLENLEELMSSELALIDCHDYDKLRKKLIWFGLSENELALLSLNSIEKNKADLTKIVEIHEIND